jgi:hypothetical protein
LAAIEAPVSAGSSLPGQAKSHRATPFSETQFVEGHLVQGESMSILRTPAAVAEETIATPSTMRAVVLDAPGPPSALAIR